MSEAACDVAYVGEPFPLGLTKCEMQFDCSILRPAAMSWKSVKCTCKTSSDRLFVALFSSSALFSASQFSASQILSCSFQSFDNNVSICLHACLLQIYACCTGFNNIIHFPRINITNQKIRKLEIGAWANHTIALCRFAHLDIRLFPRGRQCGTNPSWKHLPVNRIPPLPLLHLAMS